MYLITVCFYTTPISRISFESTPELVSNFHTVISSNGPTMAQTLSLRFIAETRQIAAIMRGGDIIMISVDVEGAPVRDSLLESL